MVRVGCRSVLGFEAGANISLPDRLRSGRYLAGSVDSGLDLNEISLDLVDFMLLFIGKSKISPNLVDFKKLFVRKPLNLARFCWFYGRVRWLGFLGSKPASRPKGIGSCGWQPPGDCRIDQFGWWPVGFGRVRRVERVTGLFGHPDNWHPIGTLSLEFGYSVIYAGSKPEAKVVCFDFWLLRDKVWIWKLATSIFMVRFRKSVTLWKSME